MKNTKTPLKIILLSLAVFFIAFTLSNCVTETASPSGNDRSLGDILTDGSWEQYDYLVNDTSKWDDIGACYKDDYNTYEPNGEFIYDNGALKCYPTDSQTYKGHWSFSNNEQEFVSTLLGGPDTSQIQTLTETNFILRKNSYGKSYEIRYRKK